MDNFLQSLLGNIKNEVSPIQAVLMDYLGLRQNPMGGTYRDFEQPLSTQYGTFMDPMTLGMMTPETLDILDQLQRAKSERMMDSNWNENKFNWPLRGVSGLGTQVMP